MVCVSHRAGEPEPAHNSIRVWESGFALSCRRSGGSIVSGNHQYGLGLRAQGGWCGQQANGNAEIAARQADELELRGVLGATAAGNVRRIPTSYLGDFG